jgi:peptidoglycan hydrolase CwlO-like protein
MKKFFLIFNFLFSLFIIFTVITKAEESSSELLEKEKKYQEIINSLKTKSNTLINELEYIDNQISITNARISEVEKNLNQKNMLVADLTNYIEALVKRIDKLDRSMGIQDNAMKKRIIERYKSASDLDIINVLASGNLRTAIIKLQYLEELEDQDRKIISYMKDTKTDYSVQQKLIEKKREEVEKVKKEIEDQKSKLLAYQDSLNKQNEEKESLLRLTQNDEAKYQRLLSQIQAELDAQNIAVGFEGKEGKKVKKGEIIGYLGNTGCSTAPHLHFAYMQGSKSIDPFPFLKGGKLAWPVTNYKVTQYYGENYNFYMRRFGVPGHLALDIVDPNNWIGSPIRAAKDGVLHFASDAKVYCPDINNSIGKGAVIDHGGGEKTIYWHLR